MGKGMRMEKTTDQTKASKKKLNIDWQAIGIQVASAVLQGAATAAGGILIHKLADRSSSQTIIDSADNVLPLKKVQNA